jgi:thiol-disulfide isomerase/thioredoxin
MNMQTFLFNGALLQKRGLDPWVGQCAKRWRLPSFVSLLFALSAMVSGASETGRPANPYGSWQATVKNPSGEEVAFILRLVQPPQESAVALSGALSVAGELINGDDRVVSTSGWMEGQTLTLRYDFYDALLTAKVDGDQLRGSFVRQWEKETLSRELQASRNVPEDSASAGAVDLTGDWLLKVGEGAKQRLWRAAFRTTNGLASGTIIPVSGDWGSMTGGWTKEGALTLNRFDGINSRLLKLSQRPDGTLSGSVDLGLFDPTRMVVAERMTAHNRSLVADLPDPNTHTRMRHPGEPFRFRFPDLDGDVLAWDDARFKGKVVIVSITGTWCPSCHEETPFLQNLFARFRKEGLEVLALAFEYTGDAQRDRKQVRIFSDRYGVTYPILLAGSTEDAPEKLPQLENFGAYPTAIFIGRDGRVRRVHAGFEGKATGERSVKLKAEIEAFVRELLGESGR